MNKYLHRLARRLILRAGVLCLCCFPVLLSADAMPCEPVGELTPICGLQAPEDIEVLPLRQRLLLSQYGELAGETGTLVEFDPETLKARVLYPASTSSPNGQLWGEKSCAAAPERFSPHGIHLSRRLSGEWQVLAVNHGSRESVEFFQLMADENNSYSLAWRGCVGFEKNAYLNDVVALPDGGFVVSHMFDRQQTDALAKAVAQRNPGHLWRWSPWEGLSVVKNSQGGMPNGLALSADARFVLANYYLDGQVKKIELRTGALGATADIPQPDNSSWLRDGRLLVVSQQGSSDEAVACAQSPKQSCGQAFAVYALDPASLQKTVVFQHSGVPMGAATVAQVVEAYMYLGSYVGDRLMRAPWRP